MQSLGGILRWEVFIESRLQKLTAERKKSIGWEQGEHTKNAFGFTEGEGNKPWTEQDKAGRGHGKLSIGQLHLSSMLSVDSHTNHPKLLRVVVLPEYCKNGTWFLEHHITLHP